MPAWCDPTWDSRASLEEKAELLAELHRRVVAFEDRPPPYFDAQGRPWDSLRAVSQAPNHHPRRCRAMCRWWTRCPMWAKRGRSFCRHHGGNRPLTNGLSRLPSIYSRHLAPTLAARLEEFLGGKQREEQLRLYEELALSRAHLVEALELQKALELGSSRGVDAITPEHMAAARTSVFSALDRVRELAVSAARVEKDLAGKVGVEQLGFFVEEIVRVVHRRLGDTDDAKLLVEDLREKVRLPRDGETDPRVEVEVAIDLSRESDSG